MQPYVYQPITYRGVTFEPWELISLDVASNAPLFLGVPPDAVRTIVVVGLCYGDEVATFLQYPNASIYGFEPMPAHIAIVQQRYAKNSQVHVYGVACAESRGQATLYETPTLGNGSLLPVDPAVSDTVATFTVDTVRLDEVTELKGKDIDVLWVDVQGAELLVLRGAAGVLPRARLIHIEVSMNAASGYIDRALKGDIDALLATYGFQEVAQGIDPRAKEGNVVYARTISADVYANTERVRTRLQPHVARQWYGKRAVSGKLYPRIARFLPRQLKDYIKRILA